MSRERIIRKKNWAIKNQKKSHRVFLGYRSCRSGNRIRDSNYDTARSNMKPVGRVKYWTGLCRLLYNLVTDHSINLTRLQSQPSYWLFLFQPGDNERRDEGIVFSSLESATFNPYDSPRLPILFALNRHPRKINFTIYDK